MRRILLAFIRAYQLTLSPLIGRECRYLPTCSHYAAEAVRRHGAWAGTWMAAARLCRCHPLGGKGYDPAPIEVAAPWYAPWRYGDWRWGVRGVPAAGAREEEGAAAHTPSASSSP